MTIVNAPAGTRCFRKAAVAYSRRSIAIRTRREQQDREKEKIMFVRQVTAHVKPGKFDLLNQRLENDVIPLLKKQKGFRDELSFFDKSKDEAVAMSFWDSRQDAEKYDRDIYPGISRKMADTLKDTPLIRSFEVNNSTWYDIHAA
jgi:heme-degrading monooxygenase HmoA